MRNPSVLTDFTILRNKCHETVKKEVGLNFLEDLLMLYVRIRAFSFAKDVQMAHKIKANKNKLKSLRKEIKKCSSNLDQSH